MPLRRLCLTARKDLLELDRQRTQYRERTLKTHIGPSVIVFNSDFKHQREETLTCGQELHPSSSHKLSFIWVMPLRL